MEIVKKKKKKINLSHFGNIGFFFFFLVRERCLVRVNGNIRKVNLFIGFKCSFGGREKFLYRNEQVLPHSHHSMLPIHTIE